MEISLMQKMTETVVAVTGTIDTNTSVQFWEALKALDYTNLNLTLDFENTSYITSAGLRVLLTIRKRLSDDTMRIINVNESIAQVFAVTGFDAILHFTCKSRQLTEKDLSECGFKSLLQKRCAEGDIHPMFTFQCKGYTWQDVDKISQIIAVDLAAQGVGKGSHVGLCSPNSINWISTFFAIQKLGGIAVLMNFALQPAEIITLSQIGDITHFCYGSIPKCSDLRGYAGAVCGEGSRIRETYYIGNDVDFTARYGEYEAIRGRFPEMYHADDASVVIFTSGSTGKPKAVLSSSRNIIEACVPVIHELRIDSADHICTFLPMFHIFGFATGIVFALYANSSSFLLDSLTVDNLMETVERYGCTMMATVPTVVLGMTQHPGFIPDRVKTLRVVVLGGAATGEKQMRYLQERMPNCHFSNVYGMSEIPAVSITGYEDTMEHITQTVGKPVKGVEIELRDAVTGKPLPVGVPGELFVRSADMIVCYYKLPVEAQPLDDEGWLATGDLGVLNEDGTIKLVGRKKELIIRGGENISPGEVAEVLCTLPEIADAKVVGVPHELLGEEVAAAVVLREGCTLNEEKIRVSLATRLAKFKIPVHYVVLPSFPLLQNGKVDGVTVKKLVLAALAERKNAEDFTD